MVAFAVMPRRSFSPRTVLQRHTSIDYIHSSGYEDHSPALYIELQCNEKNLSMTYQKEKHDMAIYRVFPFVLQYFIYSPDPFSSS